MLRALFLRDQLQHFLPETFGPPSTNPASAFFSPSVISRKLSVPNAERIFFIRHALRAGFTIDEIFNLTKIDRWFSGADQGNREF